MDDKRRRWFHFRARLFASIRSCVQRHAVVIAMALWVPAVGWGVRAILQYSNTPGRPATPPTHWPHGTGIRFRHGYATLVLFVHPHCPCSKATLGELASIMARPGKVDAYVVFYSPLSEPNGWVRSELWREAADITGVQTIEDRAGVEIRRFGASTSGQTLLYDSGGGLVFNGGITASRGHLGANEGRDSIVAWIDGGEAPRTPLPVFGCSLLGTD